MEPGKEIFDHRLSFATNCSIMTEESILLNNELLSKELKTGDKILIFRESLSIL